MTTQARRAEDGVNDSDQEASWWRYRHLEPILALYAETAVVDPRRSGMRDELATALLPIARNIAVRYAGRGEHLDDLIQVASLGLLKAIDRYDPERGHHFLSFAIPTITGEVRRHFRDRTWAMRVPRRLKDLRGEINKVVAELSAQLRRAPRPSEIAAKLHISTEEVLEALAAAQAYQASSLDQKLTDEPDGASFGNFLGQRDPAMELFTDSHALKPALAALPERQRAILVMRFYRDMTQSQIAEQIGVSQMHVSRILAATLTHLRDWLDSDDDPGRNTTAAHEVPAPRRGPA